MIKSTMVQLFNFQLVAITILFVLTEEITAQNLTCYSCKWNSLDPTCLNNPENVSNPVVTCPSNWWCQIQRQEYAQDLGVIYDFVRSCQPTYFNYVDENSQFITYFTSCNTANRCNSGKGLSPGSEGTITERSSGPLMKGLGPGMLLCVIGLLVRDLIGLHLLNDTA